MAKMKRSFTTLSLKVLLVGFLCLAPGSLEAAEPATPSPAPSPVPQISEPIQLKLNVPATRLDLYIGGEFIRSYRVAIGTAKYPTPIQDYTIRTIIWNPWWIPPDSDWAEDAEKTPPGPGNPLGVVKMMMEGPMRIHGTNSPRSIGRAASHACLRMKNDEARELAWEIQQRYSEKKDPSVLDTYRRNRRRSYYVKLLAAVPVQVDYAQVERKDDRLLLHPNHYWRRGFSDQLADALWDHPDINLDNKLIKKLDKMRRRHTVEVSIEEIRQWSQPLYSRAKPS